LGVYAPYGGNMSWPQDTGFRAVATSGWLKYITINPVVALKISPSLSIGAGLMVNYADLNMEQGLQFSQTPPNSFQFTGNGWSVGYNLGALWQPIDKISFGVSFRSSATVTLNGHTESEYPPQVPNQNVSAQMDLTFPLTTVFGVSYRPTPKWNLEFDADYTDWSSFGSTTISQSTKPRGINQNIPVNLGWQASWMYEFGVTRYFDDGWHGSAGFVFNENSVPNTYYSPLAADLDRYVFSTGAGRKGKTFDFDVAYQFCYGPAHAVSGSTSSTPTITGTSGQTADGTYKFISHAVILTVGMHF
jgi:long-chain fatty acid transport protein